MNKRHPSVFRLIAAALIACLLLAGGAFGLLGLRSVYHQFSGRLRDIHNTVADLSSRLYAFEAAQSASNHTLQTNQESLIGAAKTISREYLVPSAFDDGWAENCPPLIAHACGGIDQATYTNSREALLYNYEKGHRLFEIDFDLTQEGALIASHDESIWRSLTGADASVPYSLENFRALPLCGSYTALDFSGVVSLMTQYPDLYVITDTKYTDKPTVMLQFAQMVRTAQAENPAVLDRIIPQIYNEQMLEWVMDIHPFTSVIFTLYNTHWTPESVLRFCQNTGIRFVTLPIESIQPETISLWQASGIRTAAHTSSNREETLACFEQGIQFMYTDFLDPSQLP